MPTDTCLRRRAAAHNRRNDVSGRHASGVAETDDGATPSFLAERAAEIAGQHESIEVELLDREAIVARGMGAFAAVAQGTDTDPRMIVLRYRG